MQILVISMNYDDAITAGITNCDPYHEIARKVYLAYPTKVFVGKEEKQYEIINDISCFFSIPYSSIQIVGSAKTGKSYRKNTNFSSKDSDLDVAIVDTALFFQYMELVFKLTKGYQDRSGFTKHGGGSSFESYITYIGKGIFRPDFMPSCAQRASWRIFFEKLSASNAGLFKSISAGIYASQSFFEYKQRSSIAEFKLIQGLQ